MKKLYESILDDEDVLINKSVKYSNNPFVKIKNILLQNNIRSVINIIKNEIDFKRNFEDFEVGINDKGVITYYLPLKNTPSYKSPCILMMELYDNSPWVHFNTIDMPENSLMIFFPDPDNRIENKYIKNDLRFKDVFEYKRWLKDFIKKYDLNPSKDKYIYYI